MKKNRIEYDSPVDALVAVAKRLNHYEDKYKMQSEDFYNQYSKGKMEDDIEFIEWSNEYQHYLALKIEIERNLQNVASWAFIILRGYRDCNT